ncbi:hypothetical protein [Rathayibacter iranicus]|uniref:Uncharacterized protein n=1 Tax=Rathayibacter iranicus NCPPB 2253 = VKM Ac-1602 TaxID=1328868 RepID=A0ABX5LCX4_9MICO|nr:hypothetical protein [Rathayibacter iranicus]MWV32290.1 hypothetical protein [Rathayibacter iranicus NCPPB 2253 = VKM Ac-1602]PWJ61092.1 hypothetical protein B0H03_12030 [Rathayibacter iranicus NCPPB 2253 = VKM Ac-1602]
MHAVAAGTVDPTAQRLLATVNVPEDELAEEYAPTWFGQMTPEDFAEMFAEITPC